MRQVALSKTTSRKLPPFTYILIMRPVPPLASMIIFTAVHRQPKTIGSQIAVASTEPIRHNIIRISADLLLYVWVQLFLP